MVSSWLCPRLCISCKKLVSHSEQPQKFLKKDHLNLSSDFPDFCPPDFVFEKFPCLLGLFGFRLIVPWGLRFSFPPEGGLESRAPPCGWAGRQAWDLYILFLVNDFLGAALTCCPSPICVGRPFAMAFPHFLDCPHKDVWRANDLGNCLLLQTQSRTGKSSSSPRRDCVAFQRKDKSSFSLWTGAWPGHQQL